MEYEMRSKLILLLGLLYCSSGYGVVTLIGISNNATGVSAGKPIVRVRGESTEIDISGTEFNNANYKLPVSIDLAFGEIGEDSKVYTIVIEDKSSNLGCGGNSHVVQAKLQFQGVDIPDQKKSICVPSTVSTGIIGSNALQWQNIILAIADNPDYIKDTGLSSSNIPILFGISSWTTTQGDWGNITISKVFDGSTTFPKPLNVIQGYAGWGGDSSLPRFGFGHIADIYNNTNYILNIFRKSRSSDLAKYDFNKLVPPVSAVPKAMSWIPKRTSTDSKSAITLYAMYAPNSNDDNPPDPSTLDPITNAGGTELDPTAASAKDILKNIKSSVPSLIDQLTGRKTISNLISDKYDQYSINKYYFKIYSDEKTKFINVERCSKDTRVCEVINTIKSPVTNTANVPNYFRLVAQKDKQYGINFNIEPMTGNIIKEYLGSGVTK